MGDFNKVVSFVLGLIVVVVFLAVVTGRLNIRQRLSSDKKVVATLAPTPTPKPAKKSGGLFSFLNRPTPTPTQTIKLIIPTPRTQPTVVTNYKNNQPIIPTIAAYQPPTSKGGLTTNNATTTTSATTTIQNNQDIASIPSTGASTALIPFALSSLAAGFMLRRKK